MALTKITTDLITDSAVTTAKINNGAVTADKLASTLDLSSKTLTLPAANTPAFTKSYTSANQTITAGGALTLAHSLGAMPTLVQVRLKCTTAELGYSIGDEMIVNPSESSITNSNGMSIVPDATNLNIRFGSTATSFVIIRKDTGAISNATNANWVAIFKAWA